MLTFKARIAAMAAAFMLAASFGAQAATVTLLGTSTQGAGNTAHLYAGNFDGTVPDGAVFSSDPLVTPPPGNEPGIYQSPFNNTPLLGSQTYFSVGAVDNDGDGAPSPVTLTYSTDQSTLTILWGSIDSYNTLEFLDAGLNLVLSVTGTNIIGLFGLGGVPDNFEQVALLRFDFDQNELFRAIRFTSTQAAFEFALPRASDVPAPGAAWLLLGGMIALGAAVRRRPTRA